MTKENTGAVSTANALKMAIDYLEAKGFSISRQPIIDACKEALDTKQVCENATPAQEPVAWMYENEYGAGVLNYERNFALIDKGYKEILLYTNPHQEFHAWNSLTDDEILRIANGELDCVDEEYIKRFARAIEQELNTKNGFSDVKEKNV